MEKRDGRRSVFEVLRNARQGKRELAIYFLILITSDETRNMRTGR